MSCHVRPFTDADRDALIVFWEAVFPDAPPTHDFSQSLQRKLASQPEGVFVVEQDNRIVGAVMSGYDGHRGWVYSLGVQPEFRRQGIGRALMQAVEDHMRTLNCEKINLQVRGGNETVTTFYHKLGYETEERISMGKHL